MNVVGANVVLYATNPEAPQHAKSHTWLHGALTGKESVGLCWIVVLAFLRLSTNPKIHPNPLDVTTATATVQSWLSRPNAVLLEPSSQHLSDVRELLGTNGTGGDLVNDAHIAALALDHQATVVSYDSDFGRFPGLRWRTPEQLLGE